MHSNPDQPDFSSEIAAITSLMNEAMARFGMAGEVRCDAQAAYLEGHGPAVRVPLGGLPSEWAQLPFDERTRRCNELARKLVSARRARFEEEPKPGRLISLSWLWLVFGVVLVGFLVFWGWDNPRLRQLFVSTSPSAEPAFESERERDQRMIRVCEATRSRVMRGATVSPLDVDGWVVELMLFKPGSPGLSSSAELNEFLKPHRNPGSFKLSWPKAPNIESAEGLGTEVKIHEENIGSILPGSEEPTQALRVTFSGRYVNPYFKDGERMEYIVLANALSSRLSAPFGALYARCAHSRSHHIGSWYLGPTPGGALTSLLYFMGTYSEAPQFTDAILLNDAGVMEPSAVFQRIHQRARDISREQLATWLGAHGGMIAGAKTGPIQLTFPFRDANRASRTSREISRFLDIGVDR